MGTGIEAWKMPTCDKMRRLKWLECRGKEVPNQVIKVSKLMEVLV
jgi:hypothetical protein